MKTQEAKDETAQQKKTGSKSRSSWNGGSEMVTWAIAENNLGALAFMMDAYGLQPSSKSDPFRAEQAFSRMKHHCITGVDLYILWNDCCGRDTAKAI